jgi:hypothetical protein
VRLREYKWKKIKNLPRRVLSLIHKKPIDNLVEWSSSPDQGTRSYIVISLVKEKPYFTIRGNRRRKSKKIVQNVEKTQKAENEDKVRRH